MKKKKLKNKTSYIPAALRCEFPKSRTCIVGCPDCFSVFNTGLKRKDLENGNYRKK